MKNKVISLFLAATMVLSLCPATVRAQTVSEEFSCLLYTSPSPRDAHESRMPSSA